MTYNVTDRYPVFLHYTGTHYTVMIMNLKSCCLCWKCNFQRSYSGLSKIKEVLLREIKFETSNMSTIIAKETISWVKKRVRGSEMNSYFIALRFRCSLCSETVTCTDSVFQNYLKCCITGWSNLQNYSRVWHESLFIAYSVR